MITDPLFYLFAVPAVLIVGISKGGFGGGLGLIAVPMLALTVPPTQAAAIMLPILCVMDLFALWGFRNSVDKKNLMILLPAAAFGIVLGALSFHQLSESLLLLMIGLLAVLFSLHWVWQTLSRITPKPEPRKTHKGLLLGTLAGFTSFSVHAGGPPLNFYLLPQQLDKTIYAGTTIIFFATVNYLKLVPYSMLDLLPAGNLMTSLVLIPLAPIGVKLGIYLHHRINAQLFYQLCYLFLFLTGCKLCWEGIKHIF